MSIKTRFGLPVDITRGHDDNGEEAYVVVEIAIQIAASDIRQMTRGSFPDEYYLDRATRLVLGMNETGYTPMARIRTDSIETAWRVHRHLKKLGVLK